MPESVSNPFSFGFSDNNAYLRRYGYTGLLGTANEKDYDLYNHNDEDKRYYQKNQTKTD